MGSTGWEQDFEFQRAVEQVLKDEGGDKITDDPDDPGGRTKYGITQKLLNAIGMMMRVDDLTESQAKQIYYDHFWLEYKFDQISKYEPRVVEKTFNFMVTAGPDPAFRCLQRALRSCGLDMKEDGVMGPITRGLFIGFVNRSEPDKLINSFGLLCALKSEMAGYYRDLDKPKYEAGWVARAYRG